MNFKYTLISAVLQLVSAGVLIGFAVYYRLSGRMQNFLVFLIAGIIFVILPVSGLIRAVREKKRKETEKDKEPPKKKGFL